MKTIIGVKLENRIETAVDFQAVITTFGCDIKTRLGLHDIEGCPNYGIVLLDVADKSQEELFQKLSAKWECQRMRF